MVMREAIRATLPVAMGYIPAGIAFGLFAVQQGLVWYWAVLMSLWVYAGAAQFAAVALLAAGVNTWGIIFTVGVINLRHIFYGWPLLAHLPARGWARYYALASLTDESYSLLTSQPHLQQSTQLVWVCGLNQLYWVVGTLLGAVFGTWLGMKIPGVEFALTALFAILWFEQYRALRQPWPFIVGVISYVLARCLPTQQTLFFALTIAVLLLTMKPFAQKT